MKKPVHDDSFFDPSKKAANLLDYVLREETTIEEIVSGDRSTVEAERTRAPILKQTASRIKSRVLFVSTNASILEAHTELRDKLTSLNEVFDEVHLMVLVYGGKDRTISDKIAERTWLYSKTARHWWSITSVARDIARTQLGFKDGFRPDIIIGIDPFEAGYIAMQLAEEYDRPFQIHVLQDIFSEEFKRTLRHPYWMLRLARHVLSHTESVCVSSEMIRERIKKSFSHLREPMLLPRFYNIKGILEQAHTYSPKPQKLAQYKFVALFVGQLNHDSTLYRTIDAIRTSLRSPGVVLVVIGDGPMKKEFVKRAEIFGIKDQIIFEPATVDLVSYLRAADLLIATDVTPESEEVVIKAAAIGLPLLIAETDLRKDIFTDEVDAYLCAPDDTISFAQKFSKFLNNGATRIQFSSEARSTIKDRLYEDPEMFKMAYRDAIESVLLEAEQRPTDGSSVEMAFKAV